MKYCFYKGSRTKKSSSLNGPAIKVTKKVLFSLMARPFTPPPPLLKARPREELFFCSFPNVIFFYFALLNCLKMLKL